MNIESVSDNRIFKILLIKSLGSVSDASSQWRAKKMVFEKRTGQREESFFSGSQREIVLERIWDWEQASCADRCFFSGFILNLASSTTWASGRLSFRSKIIIIPLVITKSAKWAFYSRCLTIFEVSFVKFITNFCLFI